MPFCVSSFAALVKGKDFILIFSPKIGEILMAAGLCLCLCLLVSLLKRISRLRRTANLSVAPEPRKV